VRNGRESPIEQWLRLPMTGPGTGALRTITPLAVRVAYHWITCQHKDAGRQRKRESGSCLRQDGGAPGDAGGGRNTGNRRPARGA